MQAASVFFLAGTGLCAGAANSPESSAHPPLPACRSAVPIPPTSPSPTPPPPTNPPRDSPHHPYSSRRSPAQPPCGAQIWWTFGWFRRGRWRDDASLLLNGSWVVVAGDSQAWLLVLALLWLLLDLAAAAAAELELFRRHSDYHAAVPARDISVDFVWAPFEGNLTRLLHEDLRLALRVPGVHVLGSRLWHMLHVLDAARYGDALASVADAASSLRSPLPVPPSQASEELGLVSTAVPGSA